MTVDSFDLRRKRSLAFRCAFGAGLLGLAGAAFAAAPGVEVQGATLRAPRPGFTATVLSMRVVSRDATRLVAASMPGVRAIELHRVVREGSEVRMEAVDDIALAAGTPVDLHLAEGRYHLMATGLKRALRGGERLMLRLTVEDQRTGARRSLQVPVQVTGRPSADTADDHMH